MNGAQQEKSAGAVIFYREKGQSYYLLLHYSSGHWDFPKGHIEKGEDEKETARREVKEETGIKDIEFVNGFKKRITYFFRKSYTSADSTKQAPSSRKKKPPLIFKEVVFYLAKTNQKDIKISFEHIGYKWLPYKEALEQLTFGNAKDVLREANDYIVKRVAHST